MKKKKNTVSKFSTSFKFNIAIDITVNGKIKIKINYIPS